MQNVKFDLLSTDKKPNLKIRYYKSCGQHKGIIIFVHGVSHGAWCWNNFVKFFTEKGYLCFVLNLRGHGDDKSNKNGRLSKYVDDVKDCVVFCEKYCKNNKIQYSKPSIIGHSMGGGIVEIYMNKYSDQIKNAILFAPATANGMKKSAITTTFSKTGRCTCPTVFGWKTNRNLLNSNFFVAKTDNKNFTPRITNKKELEFYDKHLCSENIFAMFGLIIFKLIKPNVPVFVIGSDKDAYFPTDSLNITANFYDTKPMILRGLCHDIMLDPEWEKAAESVLEFIEKPNELKNNPQRFINNLEKKIYPNRSR